MYISSSRAYAYIYIYIYYIDRYMRNTSKPSSFAITAMVFTGAKAGVEDVVSWLSTSRTLMKPLAINRDLASMNLPNSSPL